MSRIPTERAALPRGIGFGGSEHRGELVRPTILDAERNGMGQVALQQFGCLFRLAGRMAEIADQKKEIRNRLRKARVE